MMMPMTSRPELRPLLLLLLTTSSLVSSRRLLSEGEGSQNTDNSTAPQQSGLEAMSIVGSESPPTKSPLNSLSSRELDTHTMVQHVLAVTSNHTKRSETSGNPHPSTGNERHITEYSPTGTESPAGSESSSDIQLPVKNTSPGPATLPGSSTPTLPVRNSSSGSTSPPATSVPTTSAPTMPKKVTPNHITGSAVAVATTTKTTMNVQPSGERKTGQQVTKRNPAMSEHSTQSTTTTDRIKGHICSTVTPKREVLVSRCLIAIALLASLATIFVITTIVLSTMIAGRKYRRQAHLLEELDTEMICISRVAGGSEVERPVPKPRRPRSNGALIPNTEDEDGDDLTLNSFLPDTECAA